MVIVIIVWYFKLVIMNFPEKMINNDNSNGSWVKIRKIIDMFIINKDILRKQKEAGNLNIDLEV